MAVRILYLQNALTSWPPTFDITAYSQTYSELALVSRASCGSRQFCITYRRRISLRTNAILTSSVTSPDSIDAASSDYLA